jgi:predicted nucleic acid-binding protein
VKPPRLLLDSTVLIHALRERPEAVRFLSEMRARPFISTIVIGELYAGIREGRERTALERWLRGCRVVVVSEDLAVSGGLIAREYGKSHGMGLADGILAATAMTINARLVTHNLRHFPMLADVLKPY